MAAIDLAKPIVVMPSSSVCSSSSRLAPASTARRAWEATEPSEPTAAANRRRPGYDEALLRKAITRGVDSAGNRLHSTMPRYRLTLRDSADLVAYLQQLGSGPEGARSPATP